MSLDIKRAEDFCRSYGEAMKQVDAKGLAGHYGFPYVSFTLGWITTFDSREVADEACQGQIDRFERHGLGTDIRLEKFEVEPVSSGSAMCHLTWRVHPRDSTPGWAWTNIYGLRQTADNQYFEFNVSDNEIGELLARYPDIMKS